MIVDVRLQRDVNGLFRHFEVLALFSVLLPLFLPLTSSKDRREDISILFSFTVAFATGLLLSFFLKLNIDIVAIQDETLPTLG